MQEACRQNQCWQSAGLDPIKISVNVSANQLSFPTFTDTVKKAINESGLNARYLKLEFTESVSMENIEEARKIFIELKRMQVAISIDDFGTGYSSLAELKALSVDEIKIDKTFIDDITNENEANNALIVEAIIAIAQKIKVKAVAEGVETISQLSFLEKCNCDYIQGYYFSKPL